MNYWVITDTHFGHDKIVDSGYRKRDFQLPIFSSIFGNVTKEDVLIHLGDVSFKEHDYWMDALRFACQGKLWITLGNHDKSANWYLTRGADFVSDLIVIKYQGVRILFSHIPQEDLLGCDLNIHGHLHAGGHHDKDNLPKTNKHVLLAIENTNYQCVSLKSLIKR